MAETMQIGWRIEGQFVCDLARTWFWDEDKPYAQCEELILSCLGGNDLSERELKLIAQEIIEGRKKLVGVNSFELVDDNENVRPISMKLEEVARRQKIAEIRDLMSSRMIDFVDPFSTSKSKAVARENCYTTLEECRTWFWYLNDYIDRNYKRPKYPDDTDTMLLKEEDDTEAGLWLYYYPEIVYKAMSIRGSYPSGNPFKDVNAGEFWEDLYLTIKDDTRFQSKYFKRRNENYLASKRMAEEKEKRWRDFWNNIEENAKNGVEQIRKTRFLTDADKQLLATAQKSLDFTTKWLAENKEPEKGSKDSAYFIKWHTFELVNHRLSEAIQNVDASQSDRMYQLLPDDYDMWEGLISPNGDFYSCDFGGHNPKAYHLICAFPEKFPNIDYDNLAMDLSNALDDLLEQGWCATRYLPSRGAYIELPRTSRGECTKAQKDAIFDAKVKHDIQVDLSPIGF